MYNVHLWLTALQLYSDHEKQLASDLYEAVYRNNVSEVRSLLEQGADPNHQFYWSDEWREFPPLHMACFVGNLEIVMMLVDHGAPTDKADGRSNSLPLHWACWEGHKEVVQYLIQEVKCNPGKWHYISASVLYITNINTNKHTHTHLIVIDLSP